MNANLAKLLTGAMIAGIVAGASAFAEDTQNSQGEGQAVTQDKAATTDGAAKTTTTATVKKKAKKNGCNGKDGCGSKMDEGKKEKDAE